MSDALSPKHPASGSAAPGTGEHSVLIPAIPRSLAAALAITALMTVLVFTLSEMALQGIVDKERQTATLVDVRGHIRVLLQQLTTAESAQRASLLTGNAQYLAPFKTSIEQASAEYSTVLTNLGGISAEFHPQAIKLGPLLTRKIEELELGERLARQGRQSEAIALLQDGQGTALMDEVRQVAVELDNTLTAAYQRSSDEVSELLAKKRLGTAFLVVLNLLVLAVLCVQMLRHFREREARRRELAGLADNLERSVQERTVELDRLNDYLQHQSEQERANLARDLHDEFGALLTSAKMDLAWLQGRDDNSDAQRSQRLFHLSDVLDHAVDLKRQVIEGLRPFILDHLGLAAAIRWYVESACQRAEKSCRLALSEFSMGEDLALALYRIAQKAVSNALKQADVENIAVTLSANASHLRLTVQDDGAGSLSADSLPKSLTSLRQRLVKYHGMLQVESLPGKGTLLTVTLPAEKIDIS